MVGNFYITFLNPLFYLHIIRAFTYWLTLSLNDEIVRKLLDLIPVPCIKALPCFLISLSFIRFVLKDKDESCQNEKDLQVGGYREKQRKQRGKIQALPPIVANPFLSEKCIIKLMFTTSPLKEGTEDSLRTSRQCPGGGREFMSLRAIGRISVAPLTPLLSRTHKWMDSLRPRNRDLN